jgi:hypothetical protein
VTRSRRAEATPLASRVKTAAHKAGRRTARKGWILALYAKRGEFPPQAAMIGSRE